MDTIALSTALVAVLSAMSLGGGVYEARVIDPAWPGNPGLIQPARGGVDRKRFWMAMHGAFELSLIIAVVLGWQAQGVRAALVVALGAQVTLRVWSFADAIPRALAFERADPWHVEGPAALAWVRRSQARLPLSALACVAAIVAFAAS